MKPLSASAALSLVLGALAILAGLVAGSIVVDELRYGADNLGPSPLYSLALLGLGGWLVWAGLDRPARAANGEPRRWAWRRGALQVGAVALLSVPLLSISFVSSACACIPGAALKSDLRNVGSAQELYYGDGNYHYAPSLDLLSHGGEGFALSDGVHVTILEATPAGWAAAAVSENLPGMRCVVYGGRVDRPPRTFGGWTPEERNRPMCDPPPRSHYRIGILPGGVF